MHRIFFHTLSLFGLLGIVVSYHYFVESLVFRSYTVKIVEGYLLGISICSQQLSRQRAETLKVCLYLFKTLLHKLFALGLKLFVSGIGERQNDSEIEQNRDILNFSWSLVDSSQGLR